MVGDNEEDVVFGSHISVVSHGLVKILWSLSCRVPEAFFWPAAPITLPSVPLYLPPLVTKVDSSSSTIASLFRCEAFCSFACSYSNSVLVPKVRQKNVTVVEISEDSS